MHPLWLVSIGVVIVVGGILVLRLHAFLALVIAALMVGLLTPREAIEQWSVEQNAIPARQVGDEIYLASAPEDVVPDARFVALRARNGRIYPDAWLRVQSVATGGIVCSVQRPNGSFQLSRDHWILEPAAWRAARQAAEKSVGERVAEAFGTTCGKLGILIAMAAIIGKCLLDSGGADKIVRSALRITGERGAPAAFVGSGFLLSIPVFFDTVFYLMIPLGKAMRIRTGRNYLLYVLTIIAGGTMAHSLVPPTPGPLFVAEQFGVDLGTMIGAGCIVGLFSSLAGYVFAAMVNARNDLPLRETPDAPLESLEAVASQDERQLPTLTFALAPIILPVFLLAGGTIIAPWKALLPPPLALAVDTLSNKNIALTMAAVVAMSMLLWQRRQSFRDLAEAVQAALSSGGVIILITAAGGAFGMMLQQTGVTHLIQQFPTHSPALLLVFAFLVTTAVRTAQGSATVAMITAAGVFTAFANGDSLGCHPVFLALAIGCGSKPIAWMNDSGFWIMCKMSGMTEAEGLKYITPMSCLMGITGLVVTIALASIFPG